MEVREKTGARWLEVTSEVWMCNGLYLTDADVETVRRAAADDWRDNTGHECRPEDFIVTEVEEEN